MLELAVAGHVVCVSCEGYVVALDAMGGARLWTLPYESLSGVVAAGGVLFVPVWAPGGGGVHVVRVRDGRRLGSFPGMDTVQAMDGLVYVWNSGISGPAGGICAVRPGGTAGYAVVWDSPAAGYQVMGGVVFTSSGYALSGSDGAQLCAFPASALPVQVMAGGAAFTGGSSGLSVLDLRNGRQSWAFSAADTLLALADGIVYASDGEAENPAVYALRASDGTRLWTLHTVSLGSPSLVAQREMVYVGTGCPLAQIAADGTGRVQAVRAVDGAWLWRFPAAGDGVAALAAAPGVLYVCDGGTGGGMGTGGGGRVTTLLASDGARQWTFQTGGSSPRLLQAGDVIYAVADGPFPAARTLPDTAAEGKVCALRARSGGQLWSLTVPLNARGIPLPLAVRQEMAYIGGGDGLVHALRSRPD